MNELIVLFSVGSLPVTAYALCLAAGMLAAALLTAALGRRNPGAAPALSMALVVTALAALGARLMYCVTNLSYILVDLGGPDFLWQPWQGGYTLYGAILGGMAGILLYAKVTGRKAAPLMNLAAPGAALMLTAARLAEFFTGQGLGKLIEDESLHFFPIAVESVWEDWAMPVFFYEAVAALVILFVTLRLQQNGGHAAETFIILLGVTQVLLESWRMDEFIRFGFVRFNQVASAVMMAGVLAIRVVRAVRARGWKPWTILRMVLFLACIGVVILIEFALDKSAIDNRLLYVVMALTLVMMGASLLVENRRA